MDPTNFDGASDERFDEAFAEYLTLVDAGQLLDLDEFLKRHTDCADELRTCIEAEHRVRFLADIAPDLSETILGESQDRSAHKPVEPDRLLKTRMLGGYELLEQIARGGMGVVYKARQKELDRIVAIKVIGEGQFASPTAIERFRNEARLASQLQHAQIVSIHEIAEEQGILYFSMDFISGQTLADMFRERPMPPRRAAKIIKQVAEVVTYAHTQGVLHRDLKPSNILINEHGIPFITDFGLALTVDEESELTRTGEIIGTVSYISPEQAYGSASQRELGPETDIYSLGTVLYALIIGRPPFQAESAIDTLLHVREQPPVPPRQLNKSLPEDLETICLKCLEKSPQHRYRTAGELAEDLSRFINHQPILAQPCSWWKKTRRWAMRHHWVTAGIVFSILFLTAVFAEILWHGIRVNSLNSQLATSNNVLTRTQTELKAALNQSEERKNNLKQLLYIANVRGASRAYNEGDLPETHRMLQSAITGDEEQSLHGFEWEFLNKICEAPHTQLDGHNQEVHAVKYSPNGKWLVSASEAGDARIYRVGSQELFRVIQVSTESVRGLAFHPDNEIIAFCCGDGSVQLYNLLSGNRVNWFQAHPDIVYDAVWFQDGQRLITCGNERTVRIWDPQSGTLIRSFSPKTGHQEIRRIALSHHEKWVATASGSIMSVWDLKEDSLRLIRKAISRVTSVAFSPCDHWLSYGSLDSRAQVFDCLDPKDSITYESVHQDGVEAVAFSPDGRWGADVDRGGVLSLWPIDIDRQDQKRFTLNSNTTTEAVSTLAHQDRVLSLAFSPDSRQIATACHNGEVKIFDIDDYPIRKFFLFRGSMIYDALPMSDGTLLLSCTGEIVHYHPTTNQYHRLTAPETIDWKNRSDPKMALAVLNFEAGILSATPDPFDNPILSWRPVISPSLARLHSLQLSPAGNRLAGLTNQGQYLELLNSTDYEPVAGFPEIRCNAFAISPDGNSLIAARKGTDEVECWNISSSEVYLRLPGHQAQVNAVACSPDGKWIASGSENREIRVWEATTGQQVARLTGHRGPVTDVVFANNSTTLLSTGWDGTLRIWSLPLKQEMLVIGQPTEPTPGDYPLRLSQNGKYLVHRNYSGLTCYELPVH